MALATNSTPGSIVIAGDLTGTSSDIQLKPSGVTAGEYVNPNLVIDQKGRVIYAVDNPPPTDAATETELGLVKVGDNLSIDPDGTLNVDLPDATTSSTGIIQAGAGTVVIDGVLYVEGAQDATTTNKGIVQIGSGLSVTDGVVSLNAQPDATTSTKGVVQVGSGLSVSNGIVSATIPDATISSKGLVRIGSGLSVTGGVVSTNIPDATTSTLGIVQVGSGLDVTDGTISIPNASTTTKGIVQVGAGLSVTGGTISVAYPDASTATKGLAQIGAGLSVTGGVVSMVTPPNASTTVKGLVQKGAGFDDAAYADGELGIPVATETTLGRVRVGGSGIASTAGVLSAVDATVSIKGVVQVGTNLLVASGVVSIDPAWSSAVDPVRASPSTSNLYTATQGTGFGYTIGSGLLPAYIGETNWVLGGTSAKHATGTYGTGITVDLPVASSGLGTGTVYAVYVEGTEFLVHVGASLNRYANLDAVPGLTSVPSDTFCIGLCNGGVITLTNNAGAGRVDVRIDGVLLTPGAGIPYISGGTRSLSGRVVYFDGYYYADVRLGPGEGVFKVYRSTDARNWVEYYESAAAATDVNVGCSSEYLVYLGRSSAGQITAYTMAAGGTFTSAGLVGIFDINPISTKTPIVVTTDGGFFAVTNSATRMQVIRRFALGTMTRYNYTGNDLLGYADDGGAIITGLPSNVEDATFVSSAYATTTDFTYWSALPVTRRDSSTDIVWRYLGVPVFFKTTPSVYVVPALSAGWRATNIPRVPNTPNAAVSSRPVLIKQTRTSATGGIVTYF